MFRRSKINPHPLFVVIAGKMFWTLQGESLSEIRPKAPGTSQWVRRLNKTSKQDGLPRFSLSLSRSLSLAVSLSPSPSLSVIPLLSLSVPLAPSHSFSVSYLSFSLFFWFKKASWTAVPRHGQSFHFCLYELLLSMVPHPTPPHHHPATPTLNRNIQVLL